MSQPSDTAFVPFADDAKVHQIAGFSIENGTAALALHGSLDITRDRAGLDRARTLRALLDRIIASMEAEALPEIVAENRTSPPTVRNPFA